jgi:hypothetical protein
MRYTIQWPGFESRKLEVHDRRDGTPPVLWIDGLEPRRDKKPGVYVVQDSAGNLVTFEMHASSSGPPTVIIDEQEVDLSTSGLTWYQWGLAGVPLVLVPVGGCVGGMLGGGGAAANYAILRKPWPAGLRYGGVIAINCAVFVAWLIVAAVVSLLTSSSPAPAPGTPSAPVSSLAPGPGLSAPIAPPPTTTPAVRPATAANLYVDNLSPDEWSVQIDSRPPAALPAYEFLALNLNPGIHDVVVTAASGPVDRVEVQVPASGVVLVNPKGAGSYTLLTAAYANSPAAGMAGGVGSEPVTGRNVIQADYGPDEDLPASVAIASRAGGSPVLSASRTRVARTAPYPWPAPQAIKALALSSAQRGALYNADDDRQLAMNLFTSLQGQPLSESDIAMLLRELDQHEDQALAALVEALDRSRDRVPTEALLALARQAPRRSLQGVSLDSAAGQGVDGWAMKTLLERDAAAPLLKDLGQLQTTARHRLLRVAWNSTPQARRAVLMATLSSPSGDATLAGESRRLLQAKDLQIDEPLAQAMAAHIAALTEADQREAWKSDWAFALHRWSSNIDPLPDWSIAHLAEAAGNDAHRRQALLSQLAKAGQIDQVVGVLKQLPAAAQAQAFRQLAFAEGLRSDPENQAKLGWVALRHSDAEVRQVGVDVLGRIPAQIPALLRETQPLLKSLPPEQAQALEKQLWQHVATRIADLDQAGRLQIITQPPAERWVKGVTLHLKQRGPQRAAEYLAIDAAYHQIESPDARLWLAREIGESAVWTRNEPEDRQAQRRIIDRGLADEAVAVRSAALAAALRFEQADWPDPAVAEGLINQVSDGAEQNRLRDLWHSHLVNVWEREARQDTRRAEANRRLLEVAAAASPAIAVKAVERVNRPGQGDPSLTPLLLPLMNKDRPATVRAAAIQKIIWYCRDDAQGRRALIGALQEETPALRLQVFESLYGWSQRKEADAAILPALKAAAARETDMQAKERMTSLLPR